MNLIGQSLAELENERLQAEADLTTALAEEIINEIDAEVLAEYRGFPLSSFKDNGNPTHLKYNPRYGF
jgi:hypothetical protein